MALTDVKIRQAKPGANTVKLTDSNGLILEIKPNGAKSWRYRYKLDGRENMFAIGNYPEVSLQEAREAREKARALVKQGKHPSHERQASKASQIDDNANTFKSMGEAWKKAHSANWSGYYLKQVKRGLEVDLYPYIGNRPMRSITPADMLGVFDRIVERGAPSVAVNVRQWASAIFCYGVGKLKADFDPVAALRHQIVKPKTENAEAMSIERLKMFMLKLKDYGGLRTTQLAIKLMLYTFVRTVEMRRGVWTEVNLDDALWVIPGGKMKMNRTHMIPLSRQSVAILKELKTITGAGVHMFPNSRRPDDIMSATTINRAMEYLGVPNTGHDFRATASTHLYEMGYPEDWVEMQLAHAEKKKTKAAYNHAKYLQDRRAMMQAWADWLDNLLTAQHEVTPPPESDLPQSADQSMPALLIQPSPTSDQS